MSVIGIAGPARSGKEVTAEFLSGHLQAAGIQCYTYRFADPLKDFLSKIFNWGYEELHGRRKDREIDCELHLDIVECVIADTFGKYVNSRSDLQHAVAVFKEVLNEAFYVSGNWLSPIIRFEASPRRVLQQVGTEWAQGFFGKDIWLSFADKELLKNPGKAMLVPDVRFWHEARWCHQNGILLSVKRDTSEYGVYSEHDSERAFDEIVLMSDDVLLNDGGLDELREECRNVAQVYLKGGYGMRVEKLGCDG